MKKRLNQLILLLNNEVLLFLSISFGVFLYVLSFQPFPHDDFDFYYRLFFKLGFAAIGFLLMFLVRILYPCLMGQITQPENEITISSIVSGMVIWILNSIAFVCYLKYIGLINITGYVLYKVVIIALVPPVVLLISDRMRKLRMEKESLISGNKELQNRADSYDENHQNLSIDFISGSNGGRLSLILKDILFMRSANNYVEIHYLEKEQVKKKLVRNTLKNIELQIKPYPNFLRCHRTCIINTHYIDKLNGNCSKHTLSIKGYPKPIPVSRQYILRIKDVI